MKTACRRRETCRLCEGRRLKLVLPLEPTPPADAYIPADRLSRKQETFPLDLFLCQDCGHVQLLDVIDPEVLFRDYLYTTSSSPGLVDHFKEYAEDVFQRFKPKKGLAVDIGSNEGVLLRLFKDRGMRVLGVDPARNVAEAATAAGIETLPRFFTQKAGAEIREKYGAAELVTANNVFAHADDMGDMAEGVRELLSPSGVFVFEVSYIVDLVLNMVFDFVYHEHLCYHSIKPMQLFLRRHGLELVDAKRLPVKGGSFRGAARPIGAKAKPSPAVTELLALEESMGADKPEMYAEFRARVDRVKGELSRLLKEAKKSGKSVAAYGASATSTTLIYHFGLGGMIDFIVDDNPLRQNRFSPGLHIPIVSSKALYEKKPDYVVLLAWRYAEPILAQHKKYTSQGGRFVMPLPDVKVL